MSGGLSIKRYQFTATLRDGVTEWALHLETDDGARSTLRIRDGEEVPVLLDMLRHDKTVYFDASTGTLRTGWAAPGVKDAH